MTERRSGTIRSWWTVGFFSAAVGHLWQDDLINKSFQMELSLKASPRWNKTSIDNTNSFLWRLFWDTLEGATLKKLLAENGSGTPRETKLRVLSLNAAVALQTRQHQNNEHVTPLIFSWKRGIYSQYVWHTGLIVSGVGSLTFGLSIKEDIICTSSSLSLSAVVSCISTQLLYYLWMCVIIL